MASSDPRRVDRRAFLALVSSGLVAGVLAAADPAGAAAATTPERVPTRVVWQLATDWHPPRGPHGKTRLVSRASRRAATFRVARTEADALDMNLHPCSFAPAVPRTVCATTFDGWWAAHARPWRNPWSGVTVELLDVRRVGPGVTLADACVPPAAEVAGDDRLAASAAGALPRTGTRAGAPALAGAGLVLAGAALAWWAGGRDRVPASAPVPGPARQGDGGGRGAPAGGPDQ